MAVINGVNLNPLNLLSGAQRTDTKNQRIAKVATQSILLAAVLAGFAVGFAHCLHHANVHGGDRFDQIGYVFGAFGSAVGMGTTVIGALFRAIGAHTTPTADARRNLEMQQRHQG